MAHSTLHVAAGMAVATVVTLPPVLAAWRRGRPLSPPFARWFLACYAAGTYAVVPGILRRLGVPDAVCDAPIMNIFLFYPWINIIKPGGITMGPLVLGAFLGFQYLLLIAALITRRRPRR